MRFFIIDEVMKNYEYIYLLLLVQCVPIRMDRLLLVFDIKLQYVENVVFLFESLSKLLIKSN